MQETIKKIKDLIEMIEATNDEQEQEHLLLKIHDAIPLISFGGLTKQCECGTNWVQNKTTKKKCYCGRDIDFNF